MCRMEPIKSNCTLLSPASVAEVAGVSVPTVYNWIKRGVLVPSHDVEGRAVFTIEEARAAAVKAVERKALAAALQLPPVPA